MKYTQSSLLLLSLLLPFAASAHTIGGTGLVSGMTHPLIGMDHLLAMLAVGVVSSIIGGRALWVVPATFLGTMLVGGAIALVGIHLPVIEQGVALSVLVLGVMIALSKKIPLGVTMGSVALFALFHGYAHGIESPTIANPALYALGFILSTTLLHISGVLVGHYALKHSTTTTLLRYSGATMGVIGVFFLVAA